MRELFAEILDAYGQTVRCKETGESWRAFVQPVRTRRSDEERQSTALGDVDQRLWLYVGPADRPVDREAVIACGQGVYRVRESVTVPFGEEDLYCRAVLAPEREMVV